MDNRNEKMEFLKTTSPPDLQNLCKHQLDIKST